MPEIQTSCIWVQMCCCITTHTQRWLSHMYMIWNMIWKIYIFISQPILYHCCCFCWSKPSPSLGLLKQCPVHSIAHFCPFLVIPLLTIVQWLPISPRVKVKALTMTYKAVCCVPLFPFDLLSLCSSFSWLYHCHTALLADSSTFQVCFLHQKCFFLLSHSVQDNSNVICQRILSPCINNKLPSPYVTPPAMFGPPCLLCPISFFSP